MVSASEIPENQPLFTIAIPTYNRAHWLQDCVRAALAQRATSFEVIVSDNASDDNTATVLKAFSDARLAIVTQTKNVGPIGNFNACVTAANGRYIVLVCDDDLVYPHLLERFGEVLQRESDLSVLVALGDTVDVASGATDRATASQRLKSGIYDGTDVLFEFLAGHISPHLCTVAMKTETLRGRGGFPDDFPHTGDLASWVPMLLDGKVGFVNEPCGAYRSHESTQTSNFAAETRLNDIQRLASLIVTRAEDTIEDPGLLRLVKKKADRYMARQVVGQITLERIKGLSRRNTIYAGWKWRAYLLELAPSNFLRLARPLAFFILPLWLCRLVRRAKRLLRGA